MAMLKSRVRFCILEVLVDVVPVEDVEDFFSDYPWCLGCCGCEGLVASAVYYERSWDEVKFYL